VVNRGPQQTHNKLKKILNKLHVHKYVSNFGPSRLIIFEPKEYLLKQRNRLNLIVGHY